MTIEQITKLLSLIFTNTIEKSDLFEKDINISDTPINKDSISLYDIVTIFNRGYKLFKRDYKQLSELNLGKRITPHYFYNNEANYLITYPKDINETRGLLHLKKENDNIKCTISNIVSSNKDKYYTKDIDIDPEIAKEYYEFFEKYNDLLRLYNERLNGFSMSDMMHSISTIINNYTIDDINDVSFAIFINNRILPKMEITLSTNIGKTVTINKERCSLFVNGIETLVEESFYDYILKNLYISTDQFKMIDKIPKAKQYKKVK